MSNIESVEINDPLIKNAAAHEEDRVTVAPPHPPTIHDAAIKVQNNVFAGAQHIETLEGKQTWGNGHHARQYVARFSLMVLLTHWKDQTEANEYAMERLHMDLGQVADVVNLVIAAANTMRPISQPKYKLL